MLPYRKIISYKYIAIIIFFTFFISSCSGIKPSSEKSGGKYFETFFVGNDGNQYFIKPLKFESKEQKENLFIDFTFRYKDEVKDSAVINFSIHSTEIYKSINYIEIKNSTIKAQSNSVKLLFNEKIKNGYLSRFTTKLPLSSVKELFKNNYWELMLKLNNKENIYYPTNRAKKTISNIQEQVFILM